MKVSEEKKEEEKGKEKEEVVVEASNKKEKSEKVDIPAEQQEKGFQDKEINENDDMDIFVNLIQEMKDAKSQLIFPNFK